MVVEAKRAFPRLGRVRTSNVGSEWKRQNNPPLASAALGAFGCRCLVFLVLAPACAAVRFGLLLSTLSRLTHILSYSKQCLGGSNFRASCKSHGAALSFGTREPGNLGEKGFSSDLFDFLSFFSFLGRSIYSRYGSLTSSASGATSRDELAGVCKKLKLRN
jgi:hypothetical protein